jgi:hypothetical protein
MLGKSSVSCHLKTAEPVKMESTALRLVRLAGGWWLVLICCEKKILLAGW